MTWRAVTVVGSAAVYFLLAVVWLGQERPRDTTTYPAGSAHSLSPEGCALAYRYLKATATGGQRVGMLTQPLGWEPPARDAVVFRLRPKPPLTNAEEAKPEERDDKRDKQRPPAPADTPAPLVSRDEEEWVRNGGRLVIGLDREMRGVKLHTPPAKVTVTKVFPVWPGVANVKPPVRRVFAGRPTPEGYALLTMGAQALLWRWPLDRGEVVLLSAPEVFENRALGEADHLALLASLAGRSRDVYFDEDAHGLGQRENLLELLLRWGLGPSLVLAALAFALLLWRHRIPIGVREDAPLARRSEAIDLVDSMALLYDRVLSRHEALDRYARAFERALALRTGLTGRPLAARVRSFVGDGALPTPDAREIGAADFDRALARINSAFRRLEEHAHARRSR